jgi:hypothetical protein
MGQECCHTTAPIVKMPSIVDIDVEQSSPFKRL